MPEVQSALRKQNANAESCQLLIARGHDDIYDIVCQMRGHPLANKLPPKQKTPRSKTPRSCKHETLVLHCGACWEVTCLQALE